MTVHVDELDITSDGWVVVRGQLSASNIAVTLVARAYFQAPEDGIWEFELTESQHGDAGLMVMRPFVEKVAFPSFHDAKGVRLIIMGSNGTSTQLTRLKS